MCRIIEAAPPPNHTHIFHAINVHATAQVWRHKCFQALLEVTLKVHPLPAVVITRHIAELPTSLTTSLPITLLFYQWSSNTATLQSIFITMIC